MLNIVESKEVISVETNSGKDLIFASPYISSKGFVTFKFTSVDGITAEYSYDDKIIILKTETKKLGLKISDKNKEWLDDFYTKEFDKVNDYFARSLTGKVDLIITGTNVDTKELLESGYNPYYVKVFEYTLNKYFNKENLDLVELGKLVLSKIDLSKYELAKDKDWDYYIVPLTDVKK